MVIMFNNILLYCFAGLDANGTRGKAFSAFLKRDLGDSIDLWHCGCHQVNLSLNDTLDLMESLKLFYIPHLRMCHSEFKRSSKNRAALKELNAAMREFDQDFNWRVFYPSLFCFTRWLGLHKCAKVLASKSNRVLMKKYAEKLRSDKFGPRKFDPYKYRKRRGMTDAREAGGDDRDGDDSDSSEDEEAARVRTGISEGRLEQDDDFVRQPRLFDSLNAAIESTPSQEECEEADEFDVGDEDASKFKSKNMLNHRVGLSDLNCGRSCYLSGILGVYKVLVESLQRVVTPEQHLAARRFRKFYVVMQKSWIGTDTSEPMYASRSFQEWIEEMKEEGKHELVRLLKKECRSFASILVKVLRSRMRSIWQYIQCLELIDPLGPEMEHYTTDAVWEALKDLCRRRGLEYHLVREQILQIRVEGPDLDKESKALIRMDLCGYLRDRRRMYQMTYVPSPTPEYDKFCQVVFSIPLTSAFVESLFSKMSYNQSKIRSRLTDSKMSSILHLHDSALPDPQRCLPSVMKLKAMIPRTLKDEMTMSKHIGDRVCAVFQGKRFHGEVTKVIFHDIHVQYMYRVVYSDGDICEYWRHELEMIRCHCVNPDIENNTSTSSDDSETDL